ncbi:Glycosyltransferase involved in cell wall bisynthesis [Geodermatophilus dictyosporus]|uniref:Glycosyltransferase involved in cell wall bisynthesis n=1 Tax=Geodermatophilus dictyosporus TaxID=1523247 RepID=A0A1I5MUC9_9ACTN|nr:glycosyltransferase family 2 protein [Geodermatophilus dictyosporus]SFP13182.1 Glycosyltransferase involved in cell wall bisynthesis [Geodermatophilus dictyosporus]
MTRSLADLRPSVRTIRPKISVVVPTYNEARNLPHVFAELPADLHEVIVVDGHSLDGTVEAARTLRPDVRIVLQNRRGKGNAMACGFSAVTGDVVVMLDADGSADPHEIPSYVAALVAGADFAKGTRFAEGGGTDDITRTRAWGNRCLNRIANLLFGTHYTDLCYGYNAFWTDCLPALELVADGPVGDEKLWGDGFEIETLINTRIAKAGLRITEVPSFERPRIHGESNLNTWRDGGRVLWALLVERVNGKSVNGRGRGPGRRGVRGRRTDAFRGSAVRLGDPVVDLPAPRTPADDATVVRPGVTEARTA